MAAVIPMPGDRSALVAWDGKTGAVLRQIDRQPKLTALALAAEGRIVAAGGQDGRIIVWSLAGDQPLMRLQTYNVSISCLAFGRDVLRVAPADGQANPADGWLLAAGDVGGNVTVWDLRRRIPRSFCRGSLHGINAVAFSPDGMTLASGANGSPILWDAATGTAVCQFEPPAHRVLSIAFAPDGQRVTFGTDRREQQAASAVVWDLEFGRGIRALRGLVGSVAKIAISPDGRFLAGLSYNWQVGIWSLDQTRLLHRLEPPPGFFVDNADLAFNHDGTRFAFSAGEVATLWDNHTGKQLGRFDLPAGLQDRLAFDPSGKRLFLFRFETKDAKVGPFKEYPWPQHPRVCRLRDLLAAEYRPPLWEITEFDRHVLLLAATSDGKRFLVNGRQSSDRTSGQRGQHLLAAYDGTTGKRLWTWPLPDDDDSGYERVDPIGAIVASPLRQPSAVGFIDIASGQIRRGHTYLPTCLGPEAAFYAGGEKSPYHGFGLYRTGDERPLVVMGLEEEVAYCYQQQFSRDGRLLAWPIRDGLIYVAKIQEVRRQLARLGLGW